MIPLRGARYTPAELETRNATAKDQLRESFMRNKPQLRRKLRLEEECFRLQTLQVEIEKIGGEVAAARCHAKE